MCDLCTTDPVAKEAAHALAADIGRRLERLGERYHLLSTGDITPHTPAAEAMGNEARAVIRDLVAEWL